MSMNFEPHELKRSYHRVPGANIIVFEPVDAADCEQSQILIASMHGGLGRALEHTFIEAIAKRGFRSAFCVPDVASFIDQFQIMDRCMALLRSLEGVKKIVLMGQSRGGGLMSCYQKIAENGVGVYQSPERLLPFPDMKLRPADGIMLLDANFGFMVMHMMSMNPALLDDHNAIRINKTLDPLSPANGFRPGGNSHYTPEFKHRFLKAQRAMYYRYLEQAQERWEKIKRGQGRFSDNEPFILPESIGVNNSAKLFSSDMSIFSHTRNAWPLLHADGNLTTQIVPRVPVHQENPGMSGTLKAAFSTTVKDFLWMELEIGEDYDYGEDYLRGINVDRCFTCAAGNVKMVSCPSLFMGHTAGYEYIQAEWEYENSAAKDKTIAFSEGLTHSWTNLDPRAGVADLASKPQYIDGVLSDADREKYGDALSAQTLYIAGWLTQPGRFL